MPKTRTRRDRTTTILIYSKNTSRGVEANFSLRDDIKNPFLLLDLDDNSSSFMKLMVNRTSADDEEMKSAVFIGDLTNTAFNEELDVADYQSLNANKYLINTTVSGTRTANALCSFVIGMMTNLDANDLMLGVTDLRDATLGAPCVLTHLDDGNFQTLSNQTLIERPGGIAHIKKRYDEIENLNRISKRVQNSNDDVETQQKKKQKESSSSNTEELTTPPELNDPAVDSGETGVPTNLNITGIKESIGSKLLEPSGESTNVSEMLDNLNESGFEENNSQESELEDESSEINQDTQEGNPNGSTAADQTQEVEGGGSLEETRKRQAELLLMSNRRLSLLQQVKHRYSYFSNRVTSYSDKSKIKLEDIRIEDIISNIEIADKSTNYEGFKEGIIRVNFIKECKQVETFVNDFAILSIAWIKIRNNIQKLNRNRTSTEQVKEISKIFNRRNMKAKSKVSSDLTMNRLMIAFLPELLVARKCFCANLVSETDETLDVEYQDLLFLASEEIRSMSGYMKYHKAMSAKIYRPKKSKKDDKLLEYGVETDNKEFLENYERWNKIVKDGAATSDNFPDRMRKAIDLDVSIGDKKQIGIKWLTEAYVYWKNKLEIQDESV